MKPLEVSIELKLTKEITDDTWRGLTLGAKALLEPDETLAQGSERLYEELAAEFKLLWGREAKSVPKGPTSVAPKPAEAHTPISKPDALLKAALEMGGEEAGDIPPAPPEEDPSWCHVHEVGMVLRTKGNQKWFSHKLEDGTFCHGSSTQEKPDPSYCPIHKVKMGKRGEGKEIWYSHKVGSGWCKGLIAEKGQR